MNTTSPHTVARHAAGRMHGRRWAPAALAAALLLLAANTGLADAIQYGSRSFSNIRILDLREGNLLFETSAGIEKSVPADLIESIELDDHPDLAEAQAAMGEERYDEAARTLSGLYPQVDAGHLQTLVLGKLVTALDRAGKTERAVQRYLELLDRDQSTFAKAIMPRNLPEDPEQRSALAETVEAAAEQASNGGARGLMEQLVERLRSEPDATPAPTDPSSPDSRNDPIADLLSQGEAERALEMVDKRLKEPRARLSKLLRQQGEARAALGRPKDAAVSFMRVIIHFRPSSTEHYVPSLIGAGRAFQEMGKPKKARDLWEEAETLVADDSEEAGQLEQLLGSLGGQTDSNNQ